MSTEGTPLVDRPTGESVAVLGAGLMGHAIATVFAGAGYRVALYDSSPEARASVVDRVVQALVASGADAELVGQVSVHESLAVAVEDAELVVEAVAENLAVKREVFCELDQIVGPETILASNTSALPITLIAEATARPERVVGAHFWNPPHLVALVEVVRGERTSEETVARTISILERVGKSPVLVNRDIPGFIGNRLQHAMKREAIALVADGVCDAETIDKVVKEGFGPRLSVLGPMEQSDLVGLDLTLAIHKTLIPDLDRSDRPHPYLVGLVEQGKTGMGAGEGFRSWTPEQASAVRRRLSDFLAAAGAGRRRGSDESGSEEEEVTG